MQSSTTLLLKMTNYLANFFGFFLILVLKISTSFAVCHAAYLSCPVTSHMKYLEIILKGTTLHQSILLTICILKIFQIVLLLLRVKFLGYVLILRFILCLF